MRRRSSVRPSCTQQGFTDLNVLVALGVMAVLGIAVLVALIQPRSNAQRDAATLFASGWSRAEIEAPMSEKAAWQAYRACWVKREGKPFLDQGDTLMSWKDHPTPPMESVSGDVPTSAGMDSFTAEDLFDQCNQEVAHTRVQDQAVPVVRGKILTLLTDREHDVDAMSPPPWQPAPSATTTASRRSAPSA